MRIIAGQYRGRQLQTLSDRSVRPTSDKVRGAIFNALTSLGCVEKAHVLDCFAGSGALGLEALSRGANHCTFIDISKQALGLVQRNAQLVGAHTNCDFLVRDATRLEPLCTTVRPYDLIFIDPPYRKSLIQPSILSLSNGGWIQEKAWLVIESEAGCTPLLSGAFSVHGTKIYADTQVTFLHYSTNHTG